MPLNATSLRSERGAVMVLVAAALFPMVALLAFVVDVSHWFDYSRNLQNRADAAALAAGAEYGAVCFGSPTDAAMKPVGQMAQLFSGPAGSSSDLPYPYSGTDSPLQAFSQYPWASSYKNLPNLVAGSTDGGSHYHLLLNAKNYSSAGGANFDIGSLCQGDPTLDQTDKSCYQVSSATGDCVAGPMVDVKVTQDHLPLFFPLVGRPTISAHARVTLEPLQTAANLKPLGVGDGAFVPCLKVNFYDGSTLVKTIQLKRNPSAVAASGLVWDNSTDGGGSGDQLQMPAAGRNLTMQAVLYSEGSSGTCSTVRNSLTYPETSAGGSTQDGLLYLNVYPAAALGTLAANALPKIDQNGVTLRVGACAPDQYFSASGDCSVDVLANVAFASNAGAKTVKAVDTVTGQVVPMSQQGSTNNWIGTGLSAVALSGQHPVCIQVSQSAGLSSSDQSRCPNGPNSSGSVRDYSLGVQQQTFAACNEATTGCAHDESGPIVSASIGEVTGPATIDPIKGAFAGGSNPSIVVRLVLEGLSNADPSDRCATGHCTVLRLDNAGNGNGAMDCGEGNGASSILATLLYGCPLYGATAQAPVPGCTSALYCGTWTETSDGTCNNDAARPPGAVNCVNTNNGGSNVPQCIAELVQTGGTVNPNNCNVNANTGCAVDHWLVGDGVPQNDPRVISTFIVFSGDLINASGNTPIPIRKFASFYVTGWKFQGGNQVTCPAGLTPTQENEPAPPSVAGANNAIWGHWITYTQVGGSGTGQTCNFQDFGDCVAVLTR
jgi:hypothetical protein